MRLNQNKVGYSLALASCVLGLSQPLALAGQDRGGGHGIRECDGSISFLDLRGNADEPSVKLDLFKDARTSQAAFRADAIFREIYQKHPYFGAALLKSYYAMNWGLACLPLGSIRDSGVATQYDNFVQVARQDEERNVLVDQQIFPQWDQRLQTALIIHEAFLGKLGLKMPRDQLRKVVQALAESDAPDLGAMSSALDSIDPAIIRGQFHETMYVANNENLRYHGRDINDGCGPMRMSVVALLGARPSHKNAKALFWTLDESVGNRASADTYDLGTFWGTEPEADKVELTGHCYGDYFALSVNGVEQWGIGRDHNLANFMVAAPSLRLR